MQGQSWSSAKNYYESIHILLIKGQILASDEIISANGLFSALIDTYIYNEVIDEYGLSQQIEALEARNAQALSIPINILNPTTLSSIWQNNKLIQEMQKDIESLRDLEAATANLYDEAKAFFAIVETGLGQIRDNKYFDPETKLFDAGAINLAWYIWASVIINTHWEKAKVYDDNGLYGGDQGSPIDRFNSGDQEIKDLVRKYFPNMSDDEIEAYLEALNNEGCGYVALVNTLFSDYAGREDEFEATFGFPMYVTDANGKRQFNFDALLIDMYAKVDNKSQWWNPSTWGDDGTTESNREYRFNEYLSEYGLSAEFENDIEVTVENYNKYKNQGQLTVSARPIFLEDVNGNEVDNRDSGHAMTITGVTADGRFIVSSWGKEYYLNPDDFNNNSDTGFLTMQVVTVE